MFRVSLDEGFDEGCFPNARGTNDRNNGRRWFGWEAVDKRNMETLFFDL